MQKFRDALSRWERKELSALEAGELLGCSERQFRRYRVRYEEDGLAGLFDRRLGKLKLALARNYEPAVRQAMGPIASHAFDGAVSFHFNTGAIGHASWVGAYKGQDWSGVRSRLALWNKAGGRVVPGLKRRRREEASRRAQKEARPERDL